MYRKQDGGFEQLTMGPHYFICYWSERILFIFILDEMSLEEESEEYDPERQEKDAGIGRFTFLHFFFGL